MEEYNIDVIRKRYQLVPRTLVFIENGDKILTLSKSKKDSYGYGKLNGVGGHIEQGEEPFEAALREVQEEAGIRVKDLELAAILFIDIHETPGIQVFIFKAAYDGGILKESDEGTLQWLSRKDFWDNENIVKDLPFLIEIVDQHKPNTAPRMIKYIYDKDGEMRID